MTDKELRLLDYLINEAASLLSNQCCNDIPDELIGQFSFDERVSIDKEYHKYNGDPECHDPTYMPMYDYSMLRFLYWKLKNAKDHNQ